MYLQHWGLDRSPFTATGAAAYPTAALNEAAARADYLVREGRRVGVLLGARGWGKTTALGVIADEQRAAGVAVARIDAAALTSRELLWRAAQGLEATPDPADTQVMLWRRIEDRLAQNRWQGQATLLLVDDACDLGPDAQQQLARLARLEQQGEGRWTVLLAMAPASLDRLTDALVHLVDLRIDLGPWSEQDTVGYIQTALVEAGRLDPVFSEGALRRLHECAQGSPRHIARLADYALLTGAGFGVEQVDGMLIEQAFDETRWSPQTVTLSA